MRIIIITQNDPFYLADNIGVLLKGLPKSHQIVGVVISSASPFGKKESFIQKAFNTKKIFGTNFFLFYSFKFIISKVFKPSLRKVLKSYNVPEIKIESSINSQESLMVIKEQQPDLLISILGNQIFKKPLIDLAPKGCVNLHTALLPKYRGLMPTFWVLKNNEAYTGVSVFYVDKGIDSGPIIVQEKLEIGNRTQQQLIYLTKKIGMDLILKTIDLIENDKVEVIPNPESEKTYYRFPSRKDVIEFNKAGKRFF